MTHFIGENSSIPLMRRFLSLLLDMSVSWAIYFYTLSLGSISVETQNLILKLLPISNSAIAKSLLINIFIFLIILICNKMAFTLLFGTSFGQLFLGISVYKHNLWSRIGGSARVILEVILMPIKLIDYPIYRGRQSLFEHMTFTKLKGSQSILIKPFGFLSIMIIIILLIYSPMFQNLSILDGIHLSFHNEKLQPLKRGESFEGYKNFTSVKYQFSALAGPENYNMYLIPSFEVKKLSKRMTMTPYLSIYSHSLKVAGHYKYKKNLNLIKLLEAAKKGNPLFSWSYPALNDLILKQDAYKKSNYLPEFGDKKLLSAEQINEIKGLIQSSFSISLKTLHKSILKNGPFISGHLKFRTSFLELLSDGGIPEVDLLRIGDHDFLRLRQKFEHFGPNKMKRIDTYIPISTVNSAVFEYSYGDGLQDEGLMQDFVTHFISHSKWSFDYNDKFKIPAKSEDMNIFNIIDYFTTAKLKEAARAELEVYIYNYFFDLAKSAISDDDQKLSGILLTSLNRILLIAKHKIKGKNEKENQIFFEQIQGLLLAVKDMNLAYFTE